MRRNLQQFVVAIACLWPSILAAQTGLEVSYGNAGVAHLSYNGVVLEDLNQTPSDTFHIWHMKVSDLSGNVLSGSQFDWGEANSGRVWNPETNTWTYSFVWGTISVQFVQSGDSLNMNVTTQNFANSGVVFDGATIYPLALHFPQLPAGFTDPSYEHLAFNTTGPSVTLADFGSGEVSAVLTDASKPLYTGFEPAGNGNNYFPIISGTAIDSMASFYPHNDRPVPPRRDRFLHRISSICSVRHAFIEHRCRRLSELGADLAGTAAMERSPDYRNRFSRQFRGINTQSAARL